MSQTITNFQNRGGGFRFTGLSAQQLMKWFQTPDTCRPDKIGRSVKFLRWSLGFIYLWFGLLKFFPNLSSAEMIAGTIIEQMSFGLLTPQISLPLLALWETAIGLSLLTGKFQRAAVFSLFFHVAGTLMPLVLLPGQTWSIPLVSATLEGQYIFKNLVTVGSALVINAAESCRK